MSTEITTKAKFLCNLCDCVSIGNKGDPLVQLVFQQYPYANCYSGRLATKKSPPGTLQIKGDGKKNRYVANLFVQFYPGSPKYPNDNIMKRLEWFGACLDKLLDVPDAESFSFPAKLGSYQDVDYFERYSNLIDDFRRKYLLRHQKPINIVDYQNNNYILDSDTSTQSIKYQQPIEKVNTNNWVDIDEMVLDEDHAAASDHEEQGIVVCRKIDLCNLKYIVSGKQSEKNNSSNTPETMQSKIKLAFKKSEQPAETAQKVTVEAQTTKKILPLKSVKTENTNTQLETSAQFKPKQNFLADDTEDEEPVKPKLKPKPKQKQNFLADDTEDVITVPQKKILKKKNVETNDVEKEIEMCTAIVAETKSNTKSYDKNPDWKKSISELAEEIHESWDPIFKDPSIMSILSQLDKDFEKELEAFGDHIEILPSPQNLIFNAFNQCQFPPKAVILGQDPYFANLNEAMGLSFSVPSGVTKPPTLVNIFKELSTDINGFKTPASGDLTKWAQQGVLLLNTALTVRYKQKESHLKMWKAFTDKIIELISQKSETSMVFILWGNPAKTREKLIKNVTKHLVLKATHPSPLGANQGGFFDCKHFSKTNEFLSKNKIAVIDWCL